MNVREREKKQSQEHKWRRLTNVRIREKKKPIQKYYSCFGTWTSEKGRQSHRKSSTSTWYCRLWNTNGDTQRNVRKMEKKTIAEVLVLCGIADSGSRLKGQCSTNVGKRRQKPLQEYSCAVVLQMLDKHQKKGEENHCSNHCSSTTTLDKTTDWDRYDPLLCSRNNKSRILWCCYPGVPFRFDICICLLKESVSVKEKKCLKET